MNATAANLIDWVLPPQSGLRQRVCEMGAREAVLRYVPRPAVAQGAWSSVPTAWCEALRAR